MPVYDFPTPAPTIQNELSELLTRHHRTTGAKALKVLLSQPGTVFDVLELSLAIDWGKSNHDSLIDLLYNAYEHIPVCDSQALREYQARLCKLERIRAQRLEQDPAADCSELDWETSFLKAEIRNSTKPRGGIKNFRQTKKLAYKRLRVGIVRLLERVENPLLHSYILQNLRTGLGFVWLGESLSVREQEREVRRAA